MKESAINFIKGSLVGIGNIIPGVSGATIALILGIYQRLINAINQIDSQFLLASSKILTGKKKHREHFIKELQRVDAGFLATLTFGALFAIYSLTFIMEFLINEHHAPTLGLFAGLILASVAVPYRLLERKSWRELLSAILAIVLVVGLSASMTEEKKIAKEISRQQKQQAPISPSAKQEQQSPVAPASSQHQWNDLAYFFIAGAIAISAMILPGISGSFILLLLGGYFEILQAIARHDFLILFAFALGCAVGLLLFTRLLKFIFDRFYSPTLAFLTGLIIGSLYEIWPFKKAIEVGDRTIYGGNILPGSFSWEVGLTLITFIIGAGLVILFYMYEAKTLSTKSQQALK